MPVSGPMAAVPVVPVVHGGLASTTAIEAVAEPYCAVAIDLLEVHSDAVDTSTAMPNAVGVQSKGPTDKYAIEAITSFIQDLAQTPVILRSDGEPATVTMLGALRDTVGGHEPIEKVIIQAAPVHPYQSMGTGERSIQTIRTPMRTLVLQLQRIVCIELPPDRPILDLGREALCLSVQQVAQAERHEPHAVRKSASREIQQTALDVRRKLHMPQTHCSTEQVGHWLNGNWLGRDSKTDEHHISTKSGNVRARAISNGYLSALWQRSGHPGRHQRLFEGDHHRNEPIKNLSHWALCRL